MIRGERSKIDGVAIIEGSFTCVGGFSIKAQAALVNTESGQTMGRGSIDTSVWSKDTLTRFRAFIESAEVDLARVYFGDEGDSGHDDEATSGGISEHLDSSGHEPTQV